METESWLMVGCLVTSVGQENWVQLLMAGLFCGVNKNVLKFIIEKVAKPGENSLNKVAFLVKFKIGQLSSEQNLNKTINKNKGVLDVLWDQNLVHKETRIKSWTG